MITFSFVKATILERFDFCIEAGKRIGQEKAWKKLMIPKHS